MSVNQLDTMIKHSITSPSQLLANNLAKVVQGVGDFLLLLDIDGRLVNFTPIPNKVLSAMII